jgi:hypothetical protein
MCVIRECSSHQTLGDEAARNGPGDRVVAAILVVLYVDNRLIASRDPVWLQESFNGSLDGLVFL